MNTCSKPQASATTRKIPSGRARAARSCRPCQSRRNGWRISLTVIGGRDISPRPGSSSSTLGSLACRGSRPTTKTPRQSVKRGRYSGKAIPSTAPERTVSCAHPSAGSPPAQPPPFSPARCSLGPSPSKPPRSITTQGRRPRRRRTRAGWQTTGPATRRRARIRASPPSGSCRASREAPRQPSRHSGSASTASTTATSSRPAPRPTTTTARRITPRGGRSCLPRRPSSRRSPFVPATT